MRRSRILAMFCMVSLLGLAAGCSDDDDDLIAGTLNPGVVASGLGGAIPAAIELPIVVGTIIAAVVPVPATRGVQTCPGTILGVCDTGTLDCSLTANPDNFDLTFTNCSIDGSLVNGPAFLATNPPSASVTFQTGFNVDGDSLLGTIDFTQTGATSFSAFYTGVSLAVDVGRADVDGGPMIIDTATNTANASNLAVFLDGSPAFPPFSSVVTIVNNAITALATDNSTTPPTMYDCSGTLSYNGEITTNLICV